MRISLNWLKDYLDIKPDLDIDQISESLTLAGLEVEAIERLADHAQKLRMGRVVRIHESAEHKTHYDVDVHGKEQRILGSASAVMEGSVIAFKAAGPDNLEFDGVVAYFLDLGFSQGAADAIVFDKDVFDVVPENLSQVKEFDDVIITLGITPNRADALSHLGISRELSALLDINPRQPMLTPKEMAGPTHEKVAIEIDDTEDCPRYACRIIENVTVRPSPLWLKLKLIASGIRPINNVVDVTNYVMLSRGQPMHAFDYAKLGCENARAKIVVRRASPGEKLTLLDGKEISLCADDVVVADNKKALALAGVMGGLTSAVSSNTTTILFESAYFSPKQVRLTARRYGISTESSYRFERGCDPNGVVDALNYAARLLSEISDAKVCREPIDTYRKRIDSIELKMRPERAQAVLGMSNDSFDQDLLRKKFLRLGIETIAKRGDAIYFRVPTYRSDLTREIDLIEEAARMIGYDKVGDVCVGLDLGVDHFNDNKSDLVIDKMRHTLAARGFFEAINYAFLPKSLQAHFITAACASNVIEIKNPLSERYGVLRQSLIPSLVKNLLHNQNNQEKSVQLFEVGSVFLGIRTDGNKPKPEILSGTLDQDSFCRERQMISGIMAGKVSFDAFDHPTKNFDFYHMKGVLTELLYSLGESTKFPDATIYFEHGASVPYLHPGESATIMHRAHQGEPIVLGHYGKLHPDITSSLDIGADTYVFELFIKDIVSVVPDVPKFKPFSRYPVIDRDVAFLVDEDVLVGDILAAAEAVDSAKDSLTNVGVFDVYRGKNIGPGKKSVAISLSLQRADRTLTDEDAEAFVGHFIRLVQEKTGAVIR
jgi:phenylalanyl-tRNA synthetase beta chain